MGKRIPCHKNYISSGIKTGGGVANDVVILTGISGELLMPLLVHIFDISTSMLTLATCACTVQVALLKKQDGHWLNSRIYA